MKPARLLVLAIALVAAGVAAFLMMRGSSTPPVVAETSAPVSTVDVLVASSELPRGQTLKAPDLKWQPWPADYAPTGSITRNEAPGALEESVGSIVRAGFLPGEPIRREKLVKADGNGFMSAVLPAGMRAAAIPIDTRGANSAGGFILPNDRVDVIRTRRDDEGSKTTGSDVQVSETILSNVRVLAIGQNVQEKNGEKVVTGETATLELTAPQVELIALAQRTGQLSLALRSLSDANQTEPTPEDSADAGSLTVVRYGVARSVAKR